MLSLLLVIAFVRLIHVNSSIEGGGGGGGYGGHLCVSIFS